MDNLVKNEFALFEDRADPFVPTATLQIYQWIADNLGRAESVEVNRASSATMCPKRRWYQRRGEKGIPLTPRKRVNFLLGDLSELTLQYFIKAGCVGPGKLYSEVIFGDLVGKVEINGKQIELFKQKELITKINDLEIVCHADGFGRKNSNGDWEVIECKSSANYGFKSFRVSGPEDYLKQAHTVMASGDCVAMGIKATRYFYLRKETGHLWDRVEPWNQEIWEKTRQEFLDVMDDKEMDPPFKLVEEMGGRKPNRKATGRLIAKFPCSYCPYLKSCHGGYQTEWAEDQDGNQRPTFIFQQGALK